MGSLQISKAKRLITAAQHGQSMADQPSKEPSGLDALTEDEVDKLLAEAAALASELSAEIGLPELPPFESPSVAVPETDSIPSEVDETSVDAKLGELENLLDETSAEVGPVTSTDAAEPPASTGDSAVPAFMEEFTKPQEASPSADSVAAASEPSADQEVSSAASIPESLDQPTQAPSPESQAAPTGGQADAQEKAVENTPQPPESSQARSIGLVSNLPSRKAEAAAPNVAGPDSAETKEVKEADEPPRSRYAMPAILGQVLAKAEPLAFVACEHIVRILEIIDGPLVRLGAIPRNIIGLVAIATMGTSLIVLLLSVF